MRMINFEFQNSVHLLVGKNFNISDTFNQLNDVQIGIYFVLYPIKKLVENFGVFKFAHVF